MLKHCINSEVNFSPNTVTFIFCQYLQERFLPHKFNKTNILAMILTNILASPLLIFLKNLTFEDYRHFISNITNVSLLYNQYCHLHSKIFKIYNVKFEKQLVSTRDPPYEVI